ncbi:MAG: flavodoxin reductase [Bacteroidetes bacterium]|nr:MAG: flavodoxin reductase [Bacteroidota bacterium]
MLGIKTEKPTGYTFIPGQATEVAVNDKEWINEKRPFTFTNLSGDDHLEFTIKTYPVHNGVTNRLLKLRPGEELIIHDVWGAIHYKGKGLFIAGGAGITPFISIFRYLRSINDTASNRLLFANKTRKDIILETELNDLLKGNVIKILSEEDIKGYKHGFINVEILKELIRPDDILYICGPPPMIDAVTKYLSNLGVSDKSVVMEV